MEYIAFVFGIFGMLAYMQMDSLKKRITNLERELTSIKGTSFHEDRSSLVETVRSCIGEKVNIELKEDDQDVDIVFYGNSKYGSNTIIDADNEWVLVRIVSAKGSKEKLIRLESLKRISMIEK